jgi:cyclophilin family peptidyl-prolyl cis-trans isomerase
MGKNQKIKLERKLEQIKREKQKKERNRKIVKSSLIFFTVLVLCAVGFLGYKKFASKINNQNSKPNELKKEQSVKKYDKYPDMVIDANKKYTAVIKTNKGDITAELDAKNTPKAVNNFVFLSQKGFYDGLIFHRIIKDFMIQGGDPEGNGSGDPGYKFDDEPVVKDYLPGTLAMANSGPNTNGSQFFIMTADYSGGKLPKNYVIFGNVITGMETVTKIAETPVESGGEGSKPTEKITIDTITVEEK